MKSFNVFIALYFASIATFAQKLPNKQSIGLVAPTSVKIDGYIAEWGSLQAYNHATDIAYTLANDAQNLYFIVTAANQAVVNKIINGGITLAINKAGKQGKADVAITYPVFEKGEKPVLNINKALLEKGADDNALATDEDVQHNNNNFAAKSKLVMVTGLAGIDTLISVYNESGIKAAVRFDNHMAYNCELAIPLNKLGLISDKFAYHIILNGESPLMKKAVSTNTPPQNEIVEAKVAAEQAQSGRNTAPTDFWGEYALAKK